MQLCPGRRTAAGLALLEVLVERTVPVLVVGAILAPLGAIEVLGVGAIDRLVYRGLNDLMGLLASRLRSEKAALVLTRDGDAGPDETVSLACTAAAGFVEGVEGVISGARRAQRPTTLSRQ